MTEKDHELIVYDERRMSFDDYMWLLERRVAEDESDADEVREQVMGGKE
jgi:hypothetical protein